MARLPASSIQLELTRGDVSDLPPGIAGEGVGSSDGFEGRSAEALDRDNSRRLGDLDMR